MVKVPFLGDLNLKEDSRDFYVCFNDFVEYLQMNHTEMDTLKNVKRFDVRQEFDQYSSGITVIDNILYIKFHSFLRYMFSHADILESCRKISTQCTKYIISTIKKYEEEESVLQLQVYQSVVASNYFQQMHENLLRAIDITAFDTPYINYQYQSGLKVIKLEYSLRLKIKRNDWLLADTCPQAANHCALFWVWEWTQTL